MVVIIKKLIVSKVEILSRNTELKVISTTNNMAKNDYKYNYP